MANQEHLDKLKEGVSVWNDWRKENNKVIPDLTGADLYGANLKGIDLHDVNLKEADLHDANLIGANLYKASCNKTNFNGADLSYATLCDAYLQNVSFQGAILIRADLCDANLEKADFTEADLQKAQIHNSNLNAAILQRANMFGAQLSGVDLSESNLTEANLKEINLIEADLYKANLNGAILQGACLQEANLTEANFEEADLQGASLTITKVFQTNFSKANLSEADLTGALCLETNFTNSNIENARVFGISVWDIQMKGLKQKNLIITKPIEPKITVDNIEVAQFIYLLLNNVNLRNVLDTITSKGVLILGRFTPERKKILDAIRNKLREHDFVPIMFDFEKVSSRDFTETIKILAGMSRFVIADITEPKSSPLELQATIPNYKIPFLPIIKKGGKPFSMFVDLQQKYNWVLPTMSYSSEDALMKGFKKGILEKAIEADKKILKEKQAPPPDIENIEDFAE